MHWIDELLFEAKWWRERIRQRLRNLWRVATFALVLAFASHWYVRKLAEIQPCDSSTDVGVKALFDLVPFLDAAGMDAPGVALIGLPLQVQNDAILEQFRRILGRPFVLIPLFESGGLAPPGRNR